MAGNMAEDTGHQTLGHSVAFAAATKSRYYELLKYPNLEDVQRIEGELDDASLPAWLSRVCGCLLKSIASESSSNTRISASHCPRIRPFNFPQAVCGFCECAKALGNKSQADASVR